MSQQQFQNKVNDINWLTVEEYIRQQIPGLTDEALQVKPFSAGYSNLTYFISIGNWQAVLRRPPFGPIPPKAHDMKRECEILEKLNRVFPLAPKPYFFCEDPSVYGSALLCDGEKRGCRSR